MSGLVNVKLDSYTRVVICCRNFWYESQVVSGGACGKL